MYREPSCISLGQFPFLPPFLPFRLKREEWNIDRVSRGRFFKDRAGVEVEEKGDGPVFSGIYVCMYVYIYKTLGWDI